MKILMVVDWYNKGGAGIAAKRLADSLANMEHDIFWAVAYTEQFEANIYKYSDTSFLFNLSNQATQKLSPLLADQQLAKQNSHNLLSIIKQIKPDVINFHNIHAGRLPGDMPTKLSINHCVVWTLHDMWALTGTCAYSYECDAYQTTCHSQCPHAAASPAMPGELVPKAHRLKLDAAKNAQHLALAAPSRWLAGLAKKSMYKKFAIHAIANSIDLNFYIPLDKRACKQSLGLNPDETILLTTNTDPSNVRKGTKYFIDMPNQYDLPKLTWISLGKSASPIHLPSHISHHQLDAIRDNRLMRIIYNAADLLVVPTLADNLPNVFLEASACGTPSLAFDVGGVSEAVVNDITGWTVLTQNTQAMFEQLSFFLKMSDQEQKSLTLSCRQFAETHFLQSQQAKSYLDVFMKLKQQKMTS
ncbi:MAG: glycosyltransferase [Phycisphaeraceae bacterium]|nr:glycosyltransferase [Phycisphaeraceae bacterium]